MPTDFGSDNTSVAAPEIVEAVQRVNEGSVPAYGFDICSHSLSEALSAFFGRPSFGLAVATGTAANCIALAAACPRYGVVLCHEKAHIVVDECMAPGVFNPGMKLLGVTGHGAKISTSTLTRTLDQMTPGLFSGIPSILSISQCTELGQVYQLHELSALRDVAQSYGLSVHIDGARLANALATLECTPKEFCDATDPRTIAFGLTKNGGLLCEVIVCFEEDLHRDITFIAKQTGHLVSKQRFLSAQLHAFLEDDRWLRFARIANDAARMISERLSNRLLINTEANEVFLRLNDQEKHNLAAAEVVYQPWIIDDQLGYRFVTNWSTSARDVETLCQAIEQ